MVSWVLLGRCSVERALLVNCGFLGRGNMCFSGMKWRVNGTLSIFCVLNLTAELFLCWILFLFVGNYFTKKCRSFLMIKGSRKFGGICTLSYSLSKIKNLKSQNILKKCFPSTVRIESYEISWKSQLFS